MRGSRVLHMPVHAGDLPASACRVLETLRDAGHEAYFVGGSVRDLYRRIVPTDYDIVTSARPGDVFALFTRTIPVGAQFGVVLVIEDGHTYEVASFRTEEGYTDGRRPDRVRHATAQEDVRRRDFTINGLLFDPLSGRLIDYVGGCADIDAGIIRTIGDPEERFAEDHLRMLRAVRFCANLDYRLDDGALRAIANQAAKIGRISAERLRDELTKILTRSGAARGMELLDRTGLLKEILPEMSALRGVEQPERFHPEGDVWNHTVRMLSLLAAEEADPCLAWAVVLHDLGKAQTRSVDERGVHFYGHVQKSEELGRKIMARLRFSGSDRERILELVRSHMLFVNVQQMRPNRLKRFLRMRDFALHLELHRLDCLGSHGMLDTYEFCRKRLAEIPEEELRPVRLITGDDLIDMGFTPGPLFGTILREVEDAQLSGSICTSEEARRMVRHRWAADCGHGGSHGREGGAKT